MAMQPRFRTNLEGLETREVLTSGDPTALIATYSFDGTGNNLGHPDWGSAGIELLRLAAAAYEDGVSAPAGSDRPSAREISNALADQGSEDIISDRWLSAMIYAWGQFIDHDLGLTPTGGTESLSIAVPTGDPSFDPFATGTQTISTTRSIFDPSTGSSADNPREQINTITAWLDGSMIYGSDDAVAAALRTFAGGRLKTSDGGYLPYNNSTYFPDGALAMANDAHLVPNDQLFAAGDARANENIELTALHTLFVREHNYWANRIATADPALTDEQIYQQARARVIAELQAITFNQWLPSLLGQGAIEPYSGYDPTVNPGLSNEFSTAAFRFGHSLLGDDVEFLSDNGLPVAEGIELSEAFFNPGELTENGIDPLLKYLASDPASELDPMVVNSVRNFLFGPPGAGGLDLPSLNIARGRDHGLADYNTVRQAAGLPAITDFAQITSNVDVRTKLEDLYGSVDNIDLWVGALAEDHLQGSSVGPTLSAIIADQFERIRDGDRFWHQNVFSGSTLQEINRVTLSDIIKRNTSLTNLQSNPFLFRAEISGSVTLASAATPKTLKPTPSRPLAGQTVELVDSTSGEIVATAQTDAQGRYRFDVSDGVRTGRYQVRLASLADSSWTASAPRTATITKGEDFIKQVDFVVAVKSSTPSRNPVFNRANHKRDLRQPPKQRSLIRSAGQNSQTTATATNAAANATAKGQAVDALIANNSAFATDLAFRATLRRGRNR